MKFIIESGSVRFVYSNFDALTEELQKIFRLVVHFGNIELVRDGFVYRVER